MKQQKSGNNKTDKIDKVGGIMDKIRKSSIQEFTINEKKYTYYNINELKKLGYEIDTLPFSVKILLESVLRQWDGEAILDSDIEKLAGWKANTKKEEVPFKPSRVILQDFTGVPAVLDLASMRSAITKHSKSDVAADQINPEVMVDLVIDHSLQVDVYGDSDALNQNTKLEFERNKERYEFLNWSEKSFDQFRVVPPANGIVHQVNLEYLAKVVLQKEDNERTIVYPDTLVGTDSHTTMINGLSVLGWGVGGIEAEAGMLGQPSYIPVPEVIGVELVGTLSPTATATDIALTLTKILREEGVVDKFVEYFGQGVKQLTLADRATIANMAPEYGATCGFFPADEETLNYLTLTGRSKEQVALVETYLKLNGMYQEYNKKVRYSKVIQLDLATVKSALAGPKRPQDKIFLEDMKEEFIQALTKERGNKGYGLEKGVEDKKAEVTFLNGEKTEMKTGAVVIASITSCTNTSNPFVMIGAGLLAKNACEKGLKVPSYVKTSLAPGSRIVSSYLEDARLQQYLDELGFQVVGYGCATCIGNSGPLKKEIADAIVENDLLVASVLSGNRNFEGRIHALVKANYLASPPLVIAYALAGTVNIDFEKEAIGKDKSGNDVFLKDIWPERRQIEEMIAKYVTPLLYQQVYKKMYQHNELWNQIQAENSKLFPFDNASTYIRKPPFFEDFGKDLKHIKSLEGLRVLAVFGDSITTDHISPAGNIGIDTPAAKYLLEQGVAQKDFNTYGSRRGNHEVMMRGTFANIRIKNKIAPETEGGYTMYWPKKEVLSIYDASMAYKKDNIGLIVLAGKDYGMGSSRDWAAKGPALLGVKAVIAESYERIHRSNLVMMGILPLQFRNDESANSLGLTGEETFEIILKDSITPKETVKVKARLGDKAIEFEATLRFDSSIEIEYYKNGGILPMVLRKKINAIEKESKRKYI